MTVRAASCSACARVTFPPGLVCRCGALAWVDTFLSEGAVESLTALGQDGRRSESALVVLASVQTPEGCMVIARADPSVVTHDTVRLEFEADALWARLIPI
jgi:uncharacterized OB-fold protein